jgi:hypothetical protein
LAEQLRGGSDNGSKTLIRVVDRRHRLSLLSQVKTSFSGRAVSYVSKVRQ